MTNDKSRNEDGMSIPKRVATGAAVGLATAAAVGVAKKLMRDESGGDAQGNRSTGSPSRALSATRSQSRRPASSGSTGEQTRSSGRTKEQLYAQAKRLDIKGRSGMTKAQLERAIERSRK